MHLDTVGVQVMDHLCDRMVLVLNAHHLTLARDGMHQAGFCLQFLVAIILILFKAKQDRAWRKFR